MHDNEIGMHVLKKGGGGGVGDTWTIWAFFVITTHCFYEQTKNKSKPFYTTLN